MLLKKQEQDTTIKKNGDKLQFSEMLNFFWIITFFKNGDKLQFFILFFKEFNEKKADFKKKLINALYKVPKLFLEKKWISLI